MVKVMKNMAKVVSGGGLFSVLMDFLMWQAQPESTSSKMKYKNNLIFREDVNLRK